MAKEIGQHFSINTLAFKCILLLPLHICVYVQDGLTVSILIYFHFDEQLKIDS